MIVSDQALFFDFVKTSAGTFRIGATEKGLVQIHFPKDRGFIPNKRPIPGRVKKVLNASKLFLKHFFSGWSQQQNRVPVDWRFLSDFDRRVLSNLRKIKPHQTVTYSELARRSGVPRAARAVGNALNRNPLPILIPCHRVLRKDHSLGGYRCGVGWKKRLLALDQKRNEQAKESH